MTVSLVVFWLTIIALAALAVVGVLRGRHPVRRLLREVEEEGERRANGGPTDSQVW